MGSFLINRCRRKKLVHQILLYFQEKGVSIETVLNFLPAIYPVNIVDKIATTNSQIGDTNAL